MEWCELFIKSAESIIVISYFERSLWWKFLLKWLGNVIVESLLSSIPTCYFDLVINVMHLTISDNLLVSDSFFEVFKVLCDVILRFKLLCQVFDILLKLTCIY